MIFSYDRHEIETHNLSFDNGQDIRDPFGYYFCRLRCGLVFKTKATRNRYQWYFKLFNRLLQLWAKRASWQLYDKLPMFYLDVEIVFWNNKHKIILTKRLELMTWNNSSTFDSSQKLMIDCTKGFCIPVFFFSGINFTGMKNKSMVRSLQMLLFHKNKVKMTSNSTITVPNLLLDFYCLNSMIPSKKVMVTGYLNFTN